MTTGEHGASEAALQAARDAGSAQQVADASLALAAAQVLVEPNLEKLAEIVELVMGALTLLEAWNGLDTFSRQFGCI